MPSAASVSSDVSVALSRGAPPRPQGSAPQPDAQPFAALLDAAAPPPPDAGSGPSGAPAAPNQQKRTADAVSATQDGNSASAASAGTAAAAPARAPSNAAPGAGAPSKGAQTQGIKADGPHKANATSQNLDSHGSSAANGATNAALVPAPSVDGNAANATSDATANATNGGPTPAATDTAAPDPASNGATDPASNTAAAAAFAAAANVSDAMPANGVTPVATKASGNGKDDQSSGTADATNASSTANQTSGPALDAAQPVATAVVVNVATDAAPIAPKPELVAGDAVKARAKAVLTAAASDQNAPAQDGDVDAPNSPSAPDSGGSNAAASSSGLNAETADSSTATLNAQQTPDQPQALANTNAALLNPIDFAASGGAERAGLHTEAMAPLNSAAVSTAPAGSSNTTALPSFGVFAPNALTTNAAAPAANPAVAAVPVAGLAVAIAARAQAGTSQFDIRLDPPELGRIDVRLDMDGNGQVTTHVTVDRADTLQLLQSQQPQLERALEQAGLKTADNGLQFTLRDQSFAGQNSGGGGAQQQPSPPAQLIIPEPDVTPIDTAQIYARLKLGNGLDIRV